MPVVTPYIPRTITVHLGPPDQWAENVTVPFPEYVKNVASSEIYPTWEPAAIRANVLAIISFALNRVYTEFYPSRGYPFQITSSTAYDQKFIKGRNIFENISEVVDDIFDSYLRRSGFVEPLAANVDSIKLLLKNRTKITLSFFKSERLNSQHVFLRIVYFLLASKYRPLSYSFSFSKGEMQRINILHYRGGFFLYPLEFLYNPFILNQI